MNPIISKNIIAGLLLSSALLVSCENAGYDVLTNQAYISQTNTNPNTSVKIFIDQDEVKQDLNVRLSEPAKTAMKFELVEDDALLEKFNKANFTTYKHLPDEQYNISGKVLSIEAGKSISEAMQLNIQPLTTEMKESGEKYALAFSLRNKEGDAGILYPGSTIVYLLDPAIVTDVPVFGPQNNGTFNLNDELSLSEWTLEFCVNMSKLGKKIGQMNNQAIFDASSKNGKEDGEIYVRFGDAPIEGNRLQIKTQGSQMNSKMLFEENKWYHIAFACTGSKLHLYVDGKLDNTVDMPGKVTNLEKRCKIGNADWLKADVRMSELRIWQRALSQREIANNPYATDVKAEGLYAYFKLNEGEGKDFNDATGHGSKGFFQTEKWSENERLNAKK